MVAVTDDEDAAIITNEYDGLGRRIVKDVAGGGAEDRDYYYNDQWQLLTEAKDGSAYAIYHWHPFYVDALAARMRASDTHFFLHDANFNVTAAVDDDTNAVVERYSYTPYGEVTVLDADFTLDSDGGDGLSDIGNAHLYTGRERDPETGLQLNRNRFYAAHLGRWLTRDPITYDGRSFNLYQYVGSRPVRFRDGHGLSDTGWPSKPYKYCPCPKKKRRTQAACCAAAKASGLARGNAGGVICCDGRKVPCVWLTGAMAGGGGTGNPTADGIIDNCVEEHEKDHLRDVPSCSSACNSLSRPYFRFWIRFWGNQNEEECKAYRRELNCLGQNMSSCGGNTTCETAVDRRINFVTKQILARCN